MGRRTPDLVGRGERLEGWGHLGALVPYPPFLRFQGKTSVAALNTTGKHKWQIRMNAFARLIFFFKNIRKATDHSMKNSMCMSASVPMSAHAWAYEVCYS